jgi:hypothetical protein
VRISFAAAFVKVMTKIRSGGTCCFSKYRIRPVMTDVFPDPGPASTSVCPGLTLMAACWDLL